MFSCPRDLDGSRSIIDMKKPDQEPFLREPGKDLVCPLNGSDSDTAQILFEAEFFSLFF
jgi:hypothetical protein